MKHEQPTLILLCGLPGAGKTTLGRKLAKEMPTTLTRPDRVLYDQNIDLFNNAAREMIEAQQWGKVSNS